MVRPLAAACAVIAVASGGGAEAMGCIDGAFGRRANKRDRDQRQGTH